MSDVELGYINTRAMPGNLLVYRMNGHHSSSNNLPLPVTIHTNSLLIHVGMYMYFIMYPLKLITSPPAILNSAINSFCPLDIVLVFHSLHSTLLPVVPYLPCIHIHLFPSD